MRLDVQLAAVQRWRLLLLLLLFDLQHMLNVPKRLAVRMETGAQHTFATRQRSNRPFLGATRTTLAGHVALLADRTLQHRARMLCAVQLRAVQAPALEARVLGEQQLVTVAIVAAGIDVHVLTVEEATCCGGFCDHLLRG